MFRAGGDAEFGAAGPRVRSDFSLRSGQRTPVHRNERRDDIAAEIADGGILEVAGAQEMLDEPVLEAVVGQDDEAPGANRAGGDEET